MEEENKVPDENKQEIPEIQSSFKPNEDNSLEPESFEDDNTSEGLLTGSKYDIPDSKDTFVNTGDGSVVKKEDLSPFEIIKAVAKENGTKIQEPRKGCNHCNGRGFEGIDAKTKMPIPCRCIFRGKTKSEQEGENMYDAANKQHMKISRKQKRRMQRVLLSNYKLQRKFMLQKVANGENLEEEPVEKTVEDVNKEIDLVMMKYDELKSFKKTALALGMTKTKVENLLKTKKVESIETKEE